MKKTMYEKIWDSHLVVDVEGQAPLIYVDRHLMHEVTSPQAFEGLKISGRKVRNPHSILATMDHCVPTKNRNLPIADLIARKQIETMAENCLENGLNLYDMKSPNNGVIHVVVPEHGFVHPGMVVVCGDSHTATHGAFGALAFGIGTSEVEHVLATQTLLMKKSKNMLVRVDGRLQPGSTAKDIVLAVIGKIGTAGGTGSTIEFAGEAIRNLSMEGRMTVCNMAIEAGARSGLVAVDETTIEYIQGRPYAPKGPALLQALQYWRTLHSDADAKFDVVIELRAEEIAPQVTWGTSPEMVLAISESVPDPEKERDPSKRVAMERALEYMNLIPNTPLSSISVDKVFIGSCTNSRIEDMRAAAKVVDRLGKKVAANVKLALVVPGSGLVKAQAEREGLDRIFKAAGFEWREPGCSMCLAMNADRLEPGERCASTSNRNFEGRQGNGGRTHLVSPAMAAAAAIEGHFVDVRKIS